MGEIKGSKSPCCVPSLESLQFSLKFLRGDYKYKLFCIQPYKQHPHCLAGKIEPQSCLEWAGDLNIFAIYSNTVGKPFEAPLAAVDNLFQFPISK